MGRGRSSAGRSGRSGGRATPAQIDKGLQRTGSILATAKRGDIYEFSVDDNTYRYQATRSPNYSGNSWKYLGGNNRILPSAINKVEPARSVQGLIGFMATTTGKAPTAKKLN